MYCTDPKEHKANKRHVCTWCAEGIEKGERYVRWMSVDDAAFSNKMHPECYADANSEVGRWEYTPYGAERPKEAA